MRDAADRDHTPATASDPVQDADFVTPDVTQLKALAHPVRLRMLGMLRMDGPATATQLADRLGLNSGATSYHLRQLAHHGFIEEDAGHGNKRERWWHASFRSTRLDNAGRAASQNDREAVGAFWQALAVTDIDQLTAAFRERTELPDRWAEVSDSSVWVIWLTADQAEDMLRRVHRMIDAISRAAPRDRGTATAEAEQFMIQVHGFPRPGRLSRPGRGEPEPPAAADS
ncbi:ArsR/SmtB family transcription factor [Microlunatus soli]|uniref:Helix-turn-helix domain-containing protein n=1 Tax=Microlunatus soli TaxID=630515 RepID=A0A1H1NRG4_9ACTN|nr:transcriptional regulator [Microlunatus soli]SDS00949.1 Helix-turn-helix domain-containing protein [Microlunatus soli]